MNEFELLQAFRSDRSEAAFAELVRRYAGLVYSVAKRRLANAALAEDITQIVFIRFAKTPPNLQSHAELAAWLHRTTVHVTIDTWRSENRRRNREQQATDMEIATPEDDVWKDLAPDLDEALNQLNNEDRQALLLRFFARKTMRDVGAAMGVSEDAAKMRVSRAMDRLRTQLGVRSAACTVAVLGSILAERSVEAAPAQLISRLAGMKLPVVSGVAATRGLLGLFLRISRFDLAVGALVLVAVGIGVVHYLAPSSSALPPKITMLDPLPKVTGNTTGNANPKKFGPGSFDTPVEPPPKPVKILFHVMDSETGYGLADTKIHVAYFGAGGIGEAHNLLTDNHGFAALPWPDDPTKNSGPNVFVTAEGHVPKAVGFHEGAVPADYTIKLDPALTASGLVVDEQGLPVSGVKILIQGPGDKPNQLENVDFQTCPVTNHDDGSWSCGYIPRDFTNEIRFILKKPGYAATFPVVPVAKVNLNNLILVINRGFTVTGQVLDAKNHPIVNASIKTLDGNSDQRKLGMTDEHGVFTLLGVPGETGKNGFYLEPPLETNNSGGAIIRGLASDSQLQVELAVQADGFASQARTLKLLGPTNVANFTMPPGNIFRGRVVDEAGNPIPNAIVQTDFDFKNQIEWRFDWTSHTDGNGRFEWTSAPAEEICYWFEADGYNVIRGEPLSADGSDHEITLKPLQHGQTR
ncbi:MAG: polymerase sigma factor, sigma-70 family [Pedosphaera sp.]|nr:polymerase sigma factor, sigma-70 family [Pedosphaera sp.]